MSLDFHLTGIKNYKELCWRSIGKDEIELTGFTHALVWSTMAIEMGSLTAKNIEEWQFRISAMHQVSLSLFMKKNEYYIPSIEELKPYIGLTTNVRTLTRLQFMKGHIIPRVSELARFGIKEANEPKNLSDVVSHSHHADTALQGGD